MPAEQNPVETDFERDQEIKERLKHLFSYHPKPEAIPNFNAIREAAFEFAWTVMVNTPSCADREVALHAIREAVAWANAAIALDGRK